MESFFGYEIFKLEQCNSVVGIGLACRICHANPTLLYSRRTQLHVMPVNYMNRAENQFEFTLGVNSVFPLNLVQFV